MDNIMNNLQIKKNFIYNDVYQHLMDLKSTQYEIDNKVYKVSEKKFSKTSDSTIECSYCKKHYPTFKFIEHTWNNCNKLKWDKEKKKEKGKDKVNEEARVAEDSPSNEPVST